MCPSILSFTWKHYTVWAASVKLFQSAFCFAVRVWTIFIFFSCCFGSSSANNHGIVKRRASMENGFGTRMWWKDKRVEIVYSVWIENHHTEGMDFTESTRRNLSEREIEIKYMVFDSLGYSLWSLFLLPISTSEHSWWYLSGLNTEFNICALCALECVCPNFSNLFSFRIESFLFYTSKCKYFKNVYHHTITATTIVMIWTHLTWYQHRSFHDDLWVCVKSIKFLTQFTIYVNRTWREKS